MRHARFKGSDPVRWWLATALLPLVSFSALAADPRVIPPLVQIAPVGPAIATERSFTGVVAARVQSNLGFRVPGKIVARLVDVGQEVRVGQVLMRLDSKDLTLALNARDSAVTAARAAATQAIAEEGRYRELLAAGWATRQRYDQAKAMMDSAIAQLAQAQALASMSRNEAGYSELLADADGIILEAPVEPGQVVAAGQMVIRLAHAGPREAVVNLPETLRPALGSTAKARGFGSTGPDTVAVLRQLANAADPLTRTFEARYQLEGVASAAPLGATISLSLVQQGSDDLATTPLGSLFDNGIVTGVWVFEETASTVDFRPVQVHRLFAETALVKGVRLGEQVVAVGAHLLHPGEKVRPAGRRMP
jgi:RND family efflux transporter MFP subunit